MIRTIPFCLIVLCLFSCNSTKYYHNFKTEKKKINHLTIVDPIVIINENPIKDQQKVERLEKHLDSVIKNFTVNLLEKRYSTIITKQVDIDLDSLDTIIKSLNNKNSKDTSYSLKNTLKDFQFKEDETYAMVLVYKGSYNPMFKPHTQLNGAVGAALITTSGGNQIGGESDLSLIVFNTKTKEIVMFDRKLSIEHDPRIPLEIKQMTKLMLKKMYYK